MAYRDELAVKRDAETRAREVSKEQLASVAVAHFAKSRFLYDSLEQAFPKADPGLIPFHSDVLVQIRTPKTRTEAGLYLPEETRETDLWNMQVAKVVAFGPVAFCNRETLALWPECRLPRWKRAVNQVCMFFGFRAPFAQKGWCKIGDYVRVPKYGGDRWWVDTEHSVDGKALFVLFDDLVLKGLVPPEKVLDMVAYI